MLLKPLDKLSSNAKPQKPSSHFDFGRLTKILWKLFITWWNNSLFMNISVKYVIVKVHCIFFTRV